MDFATPTFTPLVGVTNHTEFLALQRDHDAYGYSTRIFARVVQEPFIRIPDDPHDGGDNTAYVLKRALGETGASIAVMAAGKQRPAVGLFGVLLRERGFTPITNPTALTEGDVVLYSDVLLDSTEVYHVAVVHSIKAGIVCVRSQFMDWGVIQHPIKIVRRRDDTNVGIYSVYHRM